MVNLNCSKSIIFDLKCTKIAGGWGSAPDPAGGAFSAPPDLLAVRGEGGGEEGKRIEREGRGREGRGGVGRGFFPSTSTSWLRHCSTVWNPEYALWTLSRFLLGAAREYGGAL